MSKIAVDVVLLPDERMSEIVIEANRQLVGEFSDEIVLDKENALPHISLAMGCIENNDIGTVEKLLNEITATHLVPRKLKAVCIEVTKSLSGQEVSSFKIENTAELQRLHEEISNKLEPYMSWQVTADMLYEPVNITETTLRWIEDYRNKSSFANFRPHITIGYGRTQEPKLPLEFDISALALCHLGNHCTCRKTLVAVPVGT